MDLHYSSLIVKAFIIVFTAVNVNKKRKQTATLETMVYQCLVLCTISEIPGYH